MKLESSPSKPSGSDAAMAKLSAAFEKRGELFASSPDLAGSRGAKTKPEIYEGLIFHNLRRTGVHNPSQGWCADTDCDGRVWSQNALSISAVQYPRESDQKDAVRKLDADMVTE